MLPDHNNYRGKCQNMSVSVPKVIYAVASATTLNGSLAI